jgi:hypothetical protein
MDGHQEYPSLSLTSMLQIVASFCQIFCQIFSILAFQTSLNVSHTLRTGIGAPMPDIATSLAAADRP